MDKSIMMDGEPEKREVTNIQTTFDKKEVD
jgi:hypothetical protein